VLYCLENLGPWCAAAAAYLDLLAAPADEDDDPTGPGMAGEGKQQGAWKRQGQGGDGAHDKSDDESLSNEWSEDDDSGEGGGLAVLCHQLFDVAVAASGCHEVHHDAVKFIMMP